MDIHQSHTRDVRLTSGRFAQPRSTYTAFKRRGIFPKPNCARILDSQDKPIQFVLVVDDFGIKYLDHLIRSLEKYYEVAVDLDGKEFVKIELDWDYNNKQVHLLMAPYLQKALQQFDNIVSTKRQHSPYPYTEPKYGAKQQFAKYDTSAPVGKDEQKYVQKVTGKFNWYARGVDSSLLTPISALVDQQAKPTQATMQRV